jgi:RNA polymerase sigma factor (sigma-70 family)
MSSTTHVQAPADAELISAVRGGDTHAYGQLFERHVEAARRLARQLVAAGDVEDLVSEAFVKVLQVLQRGGGPDVAFRAYLLTAVRRLRVDRLRATSRLHTTDDMEMFDPGVPFRDTAVEGFESATAARAFASLPERWQLVLWHTEVEGQKPADVAPLLGMSANSVSALAYRAREGLRQAYLTQHASELDDASCQWARAHLGAYIRDGISRRDAGKVEDHLRGCRCCAAIYLELSEVNSDLGAVLAPLLLGGAAAAYTAATAAATGAAGAAAMTVQAGVMGIVGRARDLVAVHSQAAAVVGVTTAVAVTGGGFAVWNDVRPPAAISGGVAGAGLAGTPDGTPAPAPTDTDATGSTGGPDARRADLPGRNAAIASLTSSAAIPDAVAGPIGTAPAATTSLTPTPDALATTVPSVPGPDPVTSDPTGPDPTTSTGPTQDPAATSAPTSSPTTDPSGAPTPGPTSGPTDAPSAPTPPATPLPTADPPAAAARDLVLGVRPPAVTGASVDLTVVVSGIPTGETATLVVTGDPVLARAEGAACGAWQAGRLTCTVTDATPLRVHAAAGSRRTARLTLTVTSDSGPDATPGDNSATISWG